MWEKGEQCVVKTELALAKRTSQNASIILLEEPENHLSHTRLNQLIKCIFGTICRKTDTYFNT